MSSITLPTSLRSFLRVHLSTLLVGGVVVAALILLSHSYYLLFHTLAEGFSIIIAGMIFGMTWNARGMMDNGYLVVFGISFAAVGAIDLLHTLAYQGMDIFPGSLLANAKPSNLATQLWLAGRYLQALTLVAAPFFLRRKPPGALVLLVYAVAAALLALSIFTGLFPDAYLADTVPPLTPFKVYSEFVIIALYAVGSFSCCAFATLSIPTFFACWPSPSR
jgi:hypothetical protein